jgi:type II secretory pathway pseudopilin PulG
MKIHRIKRRFLTLIEMMIVMFIIALITGVLAYRYTGSLDESRAFKTKVAIERLSTILNLRAADHPEFLDNVESQWQEAVRNSPLVSNPNDLIRDGWGSTFQVGVEGNNIVVHSQRYDDYVNTHQTMFSNEGTRQ